MTAKLSKKLNVIPMPGYVVIKSLDAQTQTASGIYLPDSAGEKPQKGEIIVVGDDEINDKGIKIKSPVKAGDVVIYKKWGGSEVKIDGVEYLFSKFDDILAVVR
ncbi:MAG: 10 kDa chaperonin [Candidatus Woesebacteria bacterium GW2011_GWA1_37_8]|uniref:Co-chaperonin GroES n=2 Tax=Candidatus Woeseibacteriota TaxID=1752722 RepID=A0A0G0NL72_9BACT|nr:MAG: 10 kDa chaperonin [Microgenomates group bacterium GW2011_GWC1_37_12b]KKQ45802.1 MAG: 10 kDa chaperonin [Candidatus Woesebacteria bacterium GW2011_GWA1_37_8]KKQ86619.1 MAG: 10 kDa chaperonin [Candidatus Woesebacteria bacterium GW2011_GWB1_38_8b]